MADFTFSTPEGQTIARELLIAYLNVGTEASPEWAALGRRVEESSAEYDWGDETIQDILGSTYTTLKKPTVTQSFDPLPLDAGDKAAQKLWELGVYEQNAQALANMDMLIGHYYAGDTSNKNFAERYSACAVRVTGLGGDGGGNIDMPIEITYGGERTLGTAAKTASGVTFTPATAAASYSAPAKVNAND